MFLALSQPGGRVFSVRVDLVLGVGTANANTIERAAEEGIRVEPESTVVYLADLTVFNVVESVLHVTSMLDRMLAPKTQPEQAESDTLLSRVQDNNPGVHLKVQQPPDKVSGHWSRYQVQTKGPEFHDEWSVWNTYDDRDQALSSVRARMTEVTNRAVDFRVVAIHYRVISKFYATSSYQEG